MSYQNFIKAMKLAPKCEYFTITGEKTSQEILKSEELLKVKFSKQCLEFYQNFGYLSFYGNELFGIDPDDESNILEGNSIAYALHDRKTYNLPTEWVPIYNFGDGCMAYLDYSSKNADNEPKVIMCLYTGEQYEIVKEIAEDFGDFLLQLVEQQLENQ